MLWCFGPFFVMNNVLLAFTRNDGAPTVAMCGMIAGSLFNIVFDYIFIFPCGLGMFGAALATGFSPFVSILVLLTHLRRPSRGFHLVNTPLRVSRVPSLCAPGLSSLIGEIASGVVLLFTKPFKAGDFIEVEGDSGVIREIEMMHTYLDTPGNMRVAIPNTKMMTATITNYSTYETRRQDLTFTISYEDNLLEAMAALQQLLDTHPQVLREPEEPIVRVKEQADSAIVLLARFWCANADYWNLQYDLLQQVKLTFDDKGISIPFPQMDVHVK